MFNSQGNSAASNQAQAALNRYNITSEQVDDAQRNLLKRPRNNQTSKQESLVSVKNTLV